jgi:hypothetical protein
MRVDGQLDNVQLEQIADDAPTPGVLGRVYLNTKNALADPFMRGLSRWERILTNNYRNSSKTADYTLTYKDQLTFFNAAGGNIIATLPAAADVDGIVFELMRTDTVIANDVTVTPNALAETIDGETTFILKTKNDRIRILSSGGVWVILDHSWYTGWLAFTPATANWVTNTTVTAKYKRDGKNISAQWNFALTGAPNALTLLLCLPTGFLIDTTAMVQATAGSQLFPGNILIFDTSATERYHAWAAFNDTGSLTAYKDDGDGTLSVVNATNPMTFATGDSVAAMITNIPIVKLR